MAPSKKDRELERLARLSGTWVKIKIVCDGFMMVWTKG